MGRIVGSLADRLNEASFLPVVALGQAVTRTFLQLREQGPPSPRGGGLLVVANHASFVDPVVLQMAVRRRIRFLMTEDFYDRPVMGWFFRWMRTLRVSETQTNLASLRTARDALRDGEVVGIFPEGQLSPDGELQPGQPGAAALASLARVPILPVRIRGTFHVMRRGMRFPRPARVSVTRGEIIPAPARGRTDRDALTARIMSALAAL